MAIVVAAGRHQRRPAPISAWLSRRLLAGRRAKADGATSMLDWQKGGGPLLARVDFLESIRLACMTGGKQEPLGFAEANSSECHPGLPLIGCTMGGNSDWLFTRHRKGYDLVGGG